LIICFVGIGVGFAIAYSFKESLFVLLMQPLKSAMTPGQKLIFTGLPEAFFVYIEVSFSEGSFCSTPDPLPDVAVIAPGLYKNEQRFLLPLLVLSCFFFAGGVLFGYSVVFPMRSSISWVLNQTLSRLSPP